MTSDKELLLQDFEVYSRRALSASGLMKHIVERLYERMTRYNWVGFYLVDSKEPQYLIVGPYAGSFTPNTRIPLSRGLCGAAASTGKVVVVQDVKTDPRYLSGSSLVKSEIVVPILVKGTLSAELDVESYFAETFAAADQAFVEACASIVRRYLGKGHG